MIQEGRMLLDYVMMNAIAISKILKKYDKIHGSVSGRDFKTKLRAKRIEILQSPWLIDGMVDFGNDVMLYTLSKEELLDLFVTVGNQLSFIWNAFLNFHRINRVKIIEHLYDVWAADRKAEWSIWTVHSKIDMPTCYLRSGADDSSHRNSLGKVVVSSRHKVRFHVLNSIGKALHK